MNRRFGAVPQPGEGYNAQLRERIEARIQKARETLQAAEQELVGLEPVFACPHEWEETWTRRFDVHRAVHRQDWSCRLCRHKAP